MMRRCRVIAVALLFGCGPRVMHGFETAGSAADVRTSLGHHAGYDVKRSTMQQDTFIVVGTGARWYMAAAPGAPSRKRALEALTTKLGERLSRFPINAWGVFVDCTNQPAGVMSGCAVGPGFDMSDWRDVDAMIAIIGDCLVTEDLREQVTVTVAGMPLAF
jgi:hypothetical protein